MNASPRVVAETILAEPYFAANVKRFAMLQMEAREAKAFVDRLAAFICERFGEMPETKDLCRLGTELAELLHPMPAGAGGDAR